VTALVVSHCAVCRRRGYLIDLEDRAMAARIGGQQPLIVVQHHGGGSEIECQPGTGCKKDWL
jgi:hypothetical protein